MPPVMYSGWESFSERIALAVMIWETCSQVPGFFLIRAPNWLAASIAGKLCWSPATVWSLAVPIVETGCRSFQVTENGWMIRGRL